MKKYKVYKNGIFLESYARRYEAEDAIRVIKHYERMEAIRNLTYVPCNFYEIRR